MTLILVLLAVLFILILFFPKVIVMLMALGFVALVCYTICAVTGHKMMGYLVLVIAFYAGLTSFIEMVQPKVNETKKKIESIEKANEKWDKRLELMDKVLPDKP